jgi:hypothetical protein
MKGAKITIEVLIPTTDEREIAMARVLLGNSAQVLAKHWTLKAVRPWVSKVRSEEVELLLSSTPVTVETYEGSGVYNTIYDIVGFKE